MNKLKLAKTVVFILTFLLVFGSMLLLTQLYSRTRKIENAGPSVPINLNQPAGSRISQMLEKNGTIYLLVTDGGLPDRILVLTPSATAAPSVINIHQ